MIRPDQFDHRFICHVKIFGWEVKAICAFDDPDDVFTWTADTLHPLTYELNPTESQRVSTLAHEYLETV